MENTALNKDGAPMRNPFIVLREEFDDWAVLFNPHTGCGFGVNPVGVCLWKFLDGEHSIDGLLTALSRNALDVPESAREHLITFLRELTEHGLAADSRARWSALPPCPRWLSEDAGDGRRVLRYEQPRLVHFTQDSRALGACSAFGSMNVHSVCQTGHVASCNQGGSVNYACSPGISAGACSGGNGNTNPPCYTGNSG